MLLENNNNIVDCGDQGTWSLIGQFDQKTEDSAVIGHHLIILAWSSLSCLPAFNIKDNMISIMEQFAEYQQNISVRFISIQIRRNQTISSVYQEHLDQYHQYHPLCVHSPEY